MSPIKVEGRKREIPSYGTHKGVFADLVDRGIEKSDFTGKDQHKVAFVIQLEETDSNARRKETWSFATVSADPKSNLSKLVYEMFNEHLQVGQDIACEPAELGEGVFNFFNVPVLVNISEHESGDPGKWVTKIQRYPVNAKGEYLMGEPITVSDDFVPVADRKRDGDIPF